MVQSFKLMVSKPCSEQWDNMLPAEQGRFCNVCATSVIDFTAMDDQQVINFFLLNNQQAVCGRFKASQLHRIEIVVPFYLFQKKIALWKKYLLLLLICFSTDILPGNVSVASGNALYAQTVMPTKSKKIRKKKAGKKRICLGDFIISLPHEIVVLGYTETFPQKSFIPTGTEKTPPQNGDTVLISNVSPGDKNNRPGKRSKQSSLPYAAFVQRNRGRKKYVKNNQLD